MIKDGLILLSLLGTALFGSIVTLYVQPGPEAVILGKWQESAWEYEKVDKIDGKEKPEAHQIRDQHTENLVIHEAETWQFLPDKKLKLIGKNKEEIVEWHIKGRGNILELKHSSNMVEHYNLTELTPDKMVLNFESDIQVRGIAKLTFEKTEY